MVKTRENGMEVRKVLVKSVEKVRSMEPSKGG